MGAAAVAAVLTTMLAVPSAGTAQAAEPERLVIDLATDTGAFHGGASGSLYGIYGDGAPSRNLIEGMHLRTVSTKAQDGPQHPAPTLWRSCRRSWTPAARTSTST